MSIQQEDYGKEGSTSELVPNGLRTYRHYRVREDGTLYATVTVRDTVARGVNHAKCYAVPSARADKRCPDCSGRGYRNEVRARPPQGLGYNWLNDNWGIPSFEYDIIENKECECLRKCRTPVRACSCGFYASYSPETNFFKSLLSGWSAIPLPPIFAAVEASGRVLMGSKGVRAERMEVKALALDLGHIKFGSVARAHSGEQFASEVTALMDTLRYAGERYGVPTFGPAIPHMVEAFPPPDLSRLIKNQEK